MELEASPPILRREGFSLEPLFSLLFFCALGVFIGLLAHWMDRARIWPWMPVYVFSGALGAPEGTIPACADICPYAAALNDR